MSRPKTPLPLCIKCKRVIRKKDKTEIVGEHKVHAPGFCRGPHVRHWYIVAYDGDRPVSVGRLPDTKEEIEEWVDRVHRYRIELKKLNFRRLTTIVNKTMGPST